MINEKRSYTEYNVQTPTTDFAIGFENFATDSKDVILVTLNGVDVSTLGYTVQRANDLTIVITPAISTGVLRLQRETILDEPFHKFTAGALFTAKSMDENFAQVSHAQQEVKDTFTFVQENINGVLQLTTAAKDTALAAAATADTATASANTATANTITATAAANTARAATEAATTATNTARTATTTATTAANTATAAANTATANANTATTNSNTARTATLTATTNAITATNAAVLATTDANNAASTANTAASTANAAAVRADSVIEGKAAEITSVTATTVAAGTPASVTLGGTSQFRTFGFNIPAGATGAAGTISSATASTGAAGTSASVTLGGTTTNRTFAFTIPRGDTGATGVLPNFYANTTLEAPNTYIGADGVYKRSDDPLNASTRKVGTALGNLVERGVDGYPVNNNTIGVGQTWQDVRVNRGLGVNYTNSTGKPIVIAVQARSSQSNELAIIVVTVSGVDVRIAADVDLVSSPAGTCVIPTGAVYSVNVKNETGVVRNHSVYSWAELR